MYRPTVRYDEAFRTYIDALFHTTSLDRNQILRAALFTAAHSKEFHSLLKTYQKKGDVPLPSAPWSLAEHGFWLEQSPKTNRGGKDVNVNTGPGEAEKDNGNSCGSVTGRMGKQHFEQAQRRTGEIPSQPIKITSGGITFTLN